MSGAILNLIIEIPYPIVGVPTLDMSVLGNMHVSIGTDNVTYYLTEIDPAWEDYWRMIKYKLNCSSLQLAGRTVFYVRISSGGNNNKISSIYLHCDTETIDAQKISIANGSTSTFKILSTGQMDCFLNMYYHDRKWGI
jgi:hypothetical protein